MKHPLVGFIFLDQPHTEYSGIAHHLAVHGLESRLISLNRSGDIHWDQYGLINVRECRGYHCDSDFLAKIEALAEQLGTVSIVNSLPVIRAALDKSNYLRGLEQDGVGLIPTLWAERGENMTIEEVFQRTGWHDCVVKPAISSKSWNTYRISRNWKGIEIRTAESNPSFLSAVEFRDLLEGLLRSHTVCFQQFMPEIVTHGELSFIFIDDLFSHAVRKTVARNSWIAHECFGGTNAYYEASPSEIRWARDIHSRLLQKYGGFLYARIDGIPDGKRLRLLECELVVPRLFLAEGRAFENYALAIKKRVFA
ncbi:ATP-grasp domain-containing protein [Methylosarcina fibrata]|uniref:ATP-grasp domain-containing protein n=1 Tax=Methylosarcina fibrata TaxID=105972 RepID=UPI0003703437|nr:hypothetical protein [Methylosarcina fibrata]